MIHALIVIALGLALCALGRAVIDLTTHAALAICGLIAVFCGFVTTIFGFVVLVWPGFASTVIY